jgi:hypothetical protein
MIENFSRRWEVPMVAMGFLAGSAFLLKTCYLSLLFNTLFTLTYLGAFYAYLRFRHEVRLPIRLLALVFLALEVDALGNYFHLYGSQFGPLQYDEFSHLTVQILVTPSIIWLVEKALASRGHYLPPGLAAFFAGTTIFSLSAFYEVIELWDEIYFHGQRIWSKYDTATDLQWDVVGIVIGALIYSVLLKARRIADHGQLGSRAAA